MEIFILNILLNLLIVNAFFVIIVGNAIYSVILLILCFLNGAVLMFLFGFEYLALTLLIIYVGAIAVLFLFVVMMLPLSTGRKDRNWIHIFLFIIIYAIYLFNTNNLYLDIISNYRWNNYIYKLMDIELIGVLLYGYYYLYVIVAALLLLLSMVGAIFLTMLHSMFVKRQKIYDQININLNKNLRFLEINQKEK